MPRKPIAINNPAIIAQLTHVLHIMWEHRAEGQYFFFAEMCKDINCSKSARARLCQNAVSRKLFIPKGYKFRYHPDKAEPTEMMVKSLLSAPVEKEVNPLENFEIKVLVQELRRRGVVVEASLTTVTKF